MKFTEMQYYKESFKTSNWISSESGLEVLVKLLQTRLFGLKNFSKDNANYFNVSETQFETFLFSDKFLKQLDSVTLIDENLVKEFCENELEFWEDPKDYLKSGKMTSNKTPLADFWAFLIRNNLINYN